jgi:iron complex outermembrane receptor protein
VTTPNAAEVAAAVVTTGARDWKATTYRAGLEWDVAPSTMIYAVYSTGYSPGALSAMDPAGTAETTLEQISAGWKSQLLDNRLQFNGEFFHTTFHNRLVEGSINAYTTGAAQATCTSNAMGALVFGADTANPGAYCAFVTQNSASAPEFITQGLDLDLTWLLTADDRLTVTAEWLDASYDSRPEINGSPNLSATGLAALALTQGIGLTTGQATSISNTLNSTLDAFVGAQLQNAPKYSATLDYQHAFTFASGSKLTPRIAATYKQKYWTFGGAPGAVLSDILADSNRIEWQQAYTKWDAYSSWENADGKFTVTGYVRNLNKEVVMANYGGTYVSLEAPRTWGVTFSANF